MSKVEKHPDRAVCNPELAVELSAEERAVLARIAKQAGVKRPNALRRFLKSPPLHRTAQAYREVLERADDAKVGRLRETASK